MKTVLENVILFIVLYAFLYVCVGFCEFEIDASKWNFSQRLLTVFVPTIALIGKNMCDYLNND